MKYYTTYFCHNLIVFPSLGLYRVSQEIPQHENYDISEMREYFCTKFCS